MKENVRGPLCTVIVFLQYENIKSTQILQITVTLGSRVLQGQTEV
jgi:hypothetical protein